MLGPLMAMIGPLLMGVHPMSALIVAAILGDLALRRGSVQADLSVGYTVLARIGGISELSPTDQSLPIALRWPSPILRWAG